ncbi:MAG: LysR family transcriptional regulator [Pseudomonadaceae bacterium]|nr:LysR family transcriptional regulator [Pseudomonadaceae bacterium]
MELRHLRYFVTVAEERNLTKAAKKLFISQPPLTRAIMQLEAELQVKLFTRQARGLELTLAGAYFLPHVQQLLERLETLVEDTRRINEQRKVVFAIGFEPSIFYGQLPSLVKRLRKNRYVELVLHELTTYEQIHALKTGKIDIGFGRVHIQDPKVEQQTLFSEPLVVALPTNHALTKQIPSMQDLAKLPIITFPSAPGPSFASQIRREFNSRGLRLHIAQQVNDLQTALSMVASEIGFTLVPEQVSRVQRDGVVYIPLADQNIPSAVMASRRANDPPRAIMRLANTILEELVENRLTGRYP